MSTAAPGGESVEIAPVRMIRERLVQFELQVPVWGLIVFTVDGYIIAHKLFCEGMPTNVEMAVSSLSAGLITISEDFVRVVDQTKMLGQVIVDSEDSAGEHAFSILLKHIAENVMLACIFPSSTQLGLLTFEVENLSRYILEIVNEWDVKLHSQTMT